MCLTDALDFQNTEQTVKAAKANPRPLTQSRHPEQPIMGLLCRCIWERRGCREKAVPLLHSKTTGGQIPDHPPDH